MVVLARIGRPLRALSNRLRGAGELRLALAMTLIALLIIAGLYVYTSSVRPRALSLADIGDDDVGLLVEVEALVRSARALGGSALRLTLVDGATSLSVFVPDAHPGSPEPAILQPGARITASGEVAKSGGRLELDTSGPGALHLVARAGSEVVSAEALLDAPDHYRGLKVSVNGVIGQMTIAHGDLTILVADPSSGSSASVLVVVRVPLQESFAYRDQVEVSGRFVYGYDSGTGWRLLLDSFGHAISRSALSPGPGVLRADLGDLLADPESFDGLEVFLKGLTVVDVSDIAGTATDLASGTNRLTVFIPRDEWTRTDVIPGDKVVVVGHLEYFRPRGAWELVVDSQEEIHRTV
ncbi:MAG TPA: hypothetical protein VI893_00125 [Thermoplasmata archaeon]|nr:hypothetical protein [Thermoplasmata archaeon]